MKTKKTHTMYTCSVNELLKLKYARSISKSAFALHLYLDYFPLKYLK